MRLSGAVGLVACAALCASLGAEASTAGTFTTKGTVTRIVDGDTIDVRLASGRSERVRLLGIDTPERGECWSSNATAAAARLANERLVTLIGDASQSTRDRYGRLLAYVWLPGGKDLGFQLLAGGHARVYVYDGPFRRLPAYRAAEADGQGKGVWRCGAAAPASTRGSAGRCEPGYKPCLPRVADLDCGAIAEALKPIRVKGRDRYHLDGDGDGLGCE